MAKLFKITGLVSFIGCLGLLVYLLFTRGLDVLAMISVIISVVLGLSLIALGDLMDRVDYLEETLKIEKTQNRQDDKIQQVTCPNCKMQYDMDYPRCPICGHASKWD